MTVDPPFVTRARGWTWPGVVAATLVAAVGDAAFAFIAYVLIARRFNFETLLQYIASGLLGESAFTTGRAGIGVAALGFANGDTIQRINGLALTSADRALEVYTKLRDAPRLEFELVRRGRPVTLTIEIR